MIQIPDIYTILTDYQEIGICQSYSSLSANVLLYHCLLNSMKSRKVVLIDIKSYYICIINKTSYIFVR